MYQPTKDLSLERLLAIIASLRSEGALEPNQRQQPRVMIGGGGAMHLKVLIAPVAGTRRVPSGDNPNEPGPAYAVRVQDLSIGGIAFAHHLPLARGDTFVLDLPQRNPDGQATTAARVLCRVSHCRQTADHQFVIGAQFERPWNGPAASLETARAAA
jgi:hypothetical protein